MAFLLSLLPMLQARPLEASPALAVKIKSPKEGDQPSTWAVDVAGFIGFGDLTEAMVIVFFLDYLSGMNLRDPEGFCFSGIRDFVTALRETDDIHLGLIGFTRDPVTRQSLTADRASVARALDTGMPSGEPNTGTVIREHPRSGPLGVVGPRGQARHRGIS